MRYAELSEMRMRVQSVKRSVSVVEYGSLSLERIYDEVCEALRMRVQSEDRSVCVVEYGSLSL